MKVVTLEKGVSLLLCFRCGWHAGIYENYQLISHFISKEEGHKKISELLQSGRISEDRLKALEIKLSELNLPKSHDETHPLKKDVLIKFGNRPGCLDFHLSEVRAVTRNERVNNGPATE